MPEGCAWRDKLNPLRRRFRLRPSGFGGQVGATSPCVRGFGCAQAGFRRGFSKGLVTMENFLSQ